MFSYIRGILEEIEETLVVVENNGIGYKIFVPAQQIGIFPARGTEIKLFTYLQVKEDGLTLFGFLDKDSLDLFKKLLTVSGVGPKGALGILSVLSPNDLRIAIISQDSKAISKAPGIGAKTAQRIIIDLKDKVDIDDVVPVGEAASDNGISNQISVAKNEAIEALVALGYSAKEAKEAMANIEDDEALSVEDYLKMGLNFMR